MSRISNIIGRIALVLGAFATIAPGAVDLFNITWH